MNAGRHRVVTCYLKLEPRDRSRGKYLIKLKNRVREVVQALPRLGLDRATQDEVARDLERVQTHLRSQGNLPSTQGIAIFACGPIGLFESIPLPFVYRSRLAVDTSPLVRELASVEDEFGRLLTVVLDRTAARFFEVTAYDATELPSLRADSTRGKRFRGDDDGPSGWGEHTYNNRIREEKQRHFEAIARELFAIDRRQPAHGIVLAGTGTEAAAVEPFLHNYLVERVLGTARLNPKERQPRAGARGHPRGPRGMGARLGAGAGSRDAGERGERLVGQRDDAHAARALARPGASPPGSCRRRGARIPLRRLRPAGPHRARLPRRG